MGTYDDALLDLQLASLAIFKDPEAFETTYPQFVEAAQACLIEPDLYDPSKRLEILKVISDAFGHDHADEKIIPQIGWDIAQLLTSYLTASSSPAAPSESIACSNVAASIVALVGRFGNPREITMFAAEHVSTIINRLVTAGGPLNLDLVKAFVVYGRALCDAMSRIKAARLYTYFENIVPTLVKGMSVFHLIQPSPEPDLPDSESPQPVPSITTPTNHSRPLNGYKTFADQNSLLNVFITFAEKWSTTLIKAEDPLLRRRWSTHYFTQLAAHGMAGLPRSIGDNSVAQKELTNLVRRYMGYDLKQSFTFLDIPHPQNPSSDESEDDDDSKVPPPSGIGIVIMIALALQTGECELKETRHWIPKILNLIWLFRRVVPYLYELFSRGERLDKETADKAILVVSHFAKIIPPMSVHLDDLDSSCGQNGTSIDDMLQSLISFMATTPHHTARADCFTAFKALLRILAEDGRSRVLITMLTGTTYVAVNVAAVSILKDLVHEGLSSEKTSSIFATPFLTETFLSKLLDTSSAFYKSQVLPKNDILNDDDTFFERHAFVMHVLNFWYYLVLRDAAVRKLGIWTTYQLRRTGDGFLRTIGARCESVRKGSDKGLESSVVNDGLEECGHGDENGQELHERMMAVNMMEMVLDRIRDKVEDGIRELEDG
ncbi:hypothetical protein HK097_002376 [Rhizophlyctis rosea]|uniref:Uncharacterized protein n=1 Tax=Rhizophlyctis rosea TaxID=64517 RepID=A0AAD5S4G1_9FUNG|nr:hypothetical protein HK097_002376 [Rhizophlyctis rosea]